MGEATSTSESQRVNTGWNLAKAEELAVVGGSRDENTKGGGSNSDKRKKKSQYQEDLVGPMPEEETMMGRGKGNNGGRMRS